MIDATIYNFEDCPDCGNRRVDQNFPPGSKEMVILQTINPDDLHRFRADPISGSFKPVTVEKTECQKCPNCTRHFVVRESQ